MPTAPQSPLFIIPSEVEGRTTVAAALRAATAVLAKGADPATARLDAELLAAHLLGLTRSELLLGARAPQPAAYAALVERRARGEPLAYITGRAEFWTLSLQITPAVLVPRADSETLIEAARDSFAARSPARILDLGTGSGCLLLAALDLFGGATGRGVDSSEAALAVARENARNAGLADRSEFTLGDWGRGLDERFDLILCNPPYVAPDDPLGPGVAAFEPHAALFAGEAGLAAYRELLPQVPRLLTDRGALIIEIGAGQAGAVAAIAAEAGLRHVGGRRDLAGRERALTFAA